MKKFLTVLLVLAVASAVFAGGNKQAKGGSGLIKVGIVNLHPSESGYREANVKDMDEVFTTVNGYLTLKANYNTLNEQLDAARQFINDGVDYLLISLRIHSDKYEIYYSAYRELSNGHTSRHRRDIEKIESEKNQQKSV